MPTEQKHLFYEIFSACRIGPPAGDRLIGAGVRDIVIDKGKRALSAVLVVRDPMREEELEQVRAALVKTYGLTRADLTMICERPVIPVREEPKKQGVGKPLLGRPIRKKPIPMREVTLDSGSVAVAGRVFAVNSQELKNRKAWVLCFDMTDNTGSVRVKKFLEEAEAHPLVDKIGPKAAKEGLTLRVQGVLREDRYEREMVLDPVSIQPETLPGRKDTAEKKRVELHLHTRYSAMDALADVGKLVGRAAEWGHPAIAITDHGVAQGFPDAANAAKGKDIQILYGVEGYLDDRQVVSGPLTGPIAGEFVAVDLETTGLDPRGDRIMEIGAVLFRNGELVESFQTFADPGRPVSGAVTDLTGITPEMLEGAPSQEEALDAFLAFAKGRILVAHNAEFDLSFLFAACERLGREADFTYADTLLLSQYMLPELSRHKLNLVAEHLDVPAFRHHRAEDDAAAAGYILCRLADRLAAEGITTFEGIDGGMLARWGEAKRKFYPNHVILLAKNQTGLRNLYKLISLSHLHYFKRVPVIPRRLLEENREGIIVGSACESGVLYTALLRGRPDGMLRRIASFYDFLEIQPACNNAFLVRRGTLRGEEDIRDLNRKIVALGKELGKPVCATGDVHFLDPEDEIYRHILLTAKEFDDADESLPIYFKTTDEMLAEFSYLGEEDAQAVVVDNTNLVASWCEPVAPLPKGLFSPKLEGSAEELERLVYDKVHSLYGEDLPAIVKERVDTELHDIITCEYDVIYMSAQKLVAKSLSDGYLVGSRGSVGSSIVAYLSGITEVNALPAHYRCPNCHHADFEAGEGYGCGADMPDAVCPVCKANYEKDGFSIPFETFLGFGGDKTPDIDLNFSGEYQAKAHEHTNVLFGRDHVFRAGTIGTVAEKTAYGYVKKYLEKKGQVVSRAEESRLAQGCVNVKRTTGQHPGGLVVVPSDREIYDFCPVQRPADDPNTDIITTHFEYHSMESNLLKLDLLGHDDPTMIRMLQDLSGVNPRKIPLDDPDTMSIFTSSEKLGFVDDPLLGATGACGIPEFGTRFVRGMLLDTMPDCFDTLVRISGFSHGTDVWLGNAKDLIKSGTASVGEVIGCRDDIMLYLISCGMNEKLAFTIMEKVRKGKGLQPEWEEEMRRIRVPEWYIESCKKIKYLFPKAHAVAYVMMAFRIAWFKVHRPLDFYAAYFSIRAKAVDATVMCRGMDAARRKIDEIERKDKEATAVEQDMMVTLEVCYEFYLRGFRFETIDLYRSHPTRFLVVGEDALLPPFSAIPGLGEAAANSIAEAREGRQFISVEELSSSCPKLSKAHIEQLREMGALAGMPDTSQLTLF